MFAYLKKKKKQWGLETAMEAESNTYSNTRHNSSVLWVIRTLTATYPSKDF